MATTVVLPFICWYRQRASIVTNFLYRASIFFQPHLELGPCLPLCGLKEVCTGYLVVAFLSVGLVIMLRYYTTANITMHVHDYRFGEK